MEFHNCYEDSRRAEAYARLEFPGTYYLAYRDLPDIIREHVPGGRALDFGCGTGRSTRFLRDLGFDVVGADISPDMLKKARELDPRGDYRLMEHGDLSPFPDEAFDLVLSVFTFDNIATMDTKAALFQDIRRVLRADGRVLHLVSSPEIYVHEWASFSTAEFPENKLARTGDPVKIIQTDTDDRRPVVDILWPDSAYQEVFRRAGLETVKVFRPLARLDEPFPWINETRIAPWVIYVLKRAA